MISIMTVLHTNDRNVPSDLVMYGETSEWSII